jgi:hypothetical protein
MNRSNPNNKNATRREGTAVKLLVSFFLKPETILFGFVLFYFVIELVSVIQFQRENAFVTVAGWNPIIAITRPFLLLVGAICLLIDRPWSFVLAILVGISIIYPNVYLAFVGIAHAHGIRPFSIGAIKIWLEVMGGRQIVNTALALVILSFSLVRVYLCTVRRIRNATTTKVESTTTN